MEPLGTLSIVATPIGNLRDITLRALDVLKAADVVYCEDTRVTRKLLTHFEIDTPTKAYHAHSSAAVADRIADELESGAHIALVSDAGTPGVSDPGLELVAHIRKRTHDTVKIEAIPGASALAAAVSIAGVRLRTFTFLGFVPTKKGREKCFDAIAAAEHPSVFYESPHRIEKTLESLRVRVPEAAVAVARELTKLHESVYVGTPQEVLEELRSKPSEIRGEFVVIVSTS